MEEHTTTPPEGTMEEAWGLASPGKGEARRREHSQPQPCLDLRTDREGGELRFVFVSVRTNKRHHHHRGAKAGEIQARRGRFVSRDGTEKW
jgi:hypothetical protein